MTTNLPDDVRRALAAGEKIEAIRLLRERTGLGLAEAKAAVESGLVPPARQDALMAAPAAAAEAASMDGTLSAEARAALAAGRKIEAIRMVRAERRIGLKDAKAIVDAAERGLPRVPEAAGGGRRGVLGPVVLLLVAVLAGIGWLLLGRG